MFSLRWRWLFFVIVLGVLLILKLLDMHSYSSKRFADFSLKPILLPLDERLYTKNEITLNYFNNSLSNQTKNKMIALCVSGQTSRLQPRHLLTSLINSNPAYSFYVFFNLQKHTHVFNTESNRTYTHSNYNEMEEHEIVTKLEKLYFQNASNVQGVSVNFHHSHDFKFWSAQMNGADKLDVIGEYQYTQTSILDMYNLQVACSHQIVSVEKTKIRSTFDYVISTREDVYFFTSLNITSLVINQMEIDNCSIVVKDCLSWDGINMRFQLLARNKAINFLGNRLSFYKNSLKQGKHARNRLNPERFELLQAASIGMKICRVSVSQIPATAARFVELKGEYKNDFCFINREIFSSSGLCLPISLNKTTFVKNHFCDAIDLFEFNELFSNITIYE